MDPVVEVEFREVDRARFNEIKSGVKSVETRAATEKYQSIKVGDEITFTCGADTFSKKVNKVYHWSTVEAMVSEVGLKKIAPNLDTIEQLKDAYVTYPNYPEKIDKYGILGFELN
jgi:ASC-1-like (ASCH) protein